MTTPAAAPSGWQPRHTILVVAVGAVAVAIAAIASWVLLGGDDEAEVRGTCAGTSYELSAERDSDDNRMTASLEVQANATGERWAVKIATNGRQVLDKTVEADDEGEVDAGALLGTGEQAQEVVATFAPDGKDSCTAQVRLD